MSDERVDRGHQSVLKAAAATAAETMIPVDDVHAAVDAKGCTCCPIDHAHGQAANETGTPCRPLLITAMEPVEA